MSVRIQGNSAALLRMYC